MTPEEAVRKSNQMAGDNLSKIEHLLADEAFQWFKTEAVEVELTKADEIIHNLTKTSGERDAALHRWNALNEVSAFLKQRRAIYKKHLGHEST